jgi:hypothetical protein
MVFRNYASTAPASASLAVIVPCRMLRGLLADAVDSERDLHHDVMALELFQSFPLRNEALGSAVFTIYSATGCTLSAPLPLAR